MNATEPGFTVKLRVDLSRYHPQLRVGAEGVVAMPAGRSALFRNDFIRCSFRLGDGDKTIDVRLADLEITDERYTRMIEEERRSREDALKNHVRKATMYSGPRGGFRELVIEFSNERVNEIVKRHKEARPMIEDFRARGLLEEEGK